MANGTLTASNLKCTHEAMHMRVITTQSKVSATESNIALWRDKVVPLLKQAKGFKAAYLAGDPKTGKGVAITLWETEADATASDTSGLYQQAIALFADTFTAQPIREQLEVFLEV
jgi:heme-degrading monooxygenase HmoA